MKLLEDMPSKPLSTSLRILLQIYVLKHSQPWAWPCLEASRGECSLDHSFVHVLHIRYTLLDEVYNPSCHVMMQLMNGGQDAMLKALAVARGRTSAVMLTGD